MVIGNVTGTESTPSSAETELTLNQPNVVRCVRRVLENRSSYYDNVPEIGLDNVIRNADNDSENENSDRENVN